MSERMTVSYQKKPCYDIIFEKDFQALSEELKALDFAQKKLCIITDSNVGALYASEVEKAVSSVCADTDIFTFSAGEENKNLDTVKALYSFLIEKHYTRKDCLAALGGGVTGDLTGFAAATYLRGVDFIQIPTTLLSQVDSSIGGKTGVDFGSIPYAQACLYESFHSFYSGAPSVLQRVRGSHEICPYQ